MGASGSVVENSIQTVTYMPPDLFALSDGTTTRRTINGRKIRRKNLIVRELTIEKEKQCLDELLKNKTISNEDEVRKLLTEALKGFFFLNNITDLQINMLLKVLKYEEYNEGEYVIREGEIGSTLYVIEKGDVEVLIQGEVIRTLHPGQLFGEIGLLFNAPRSASVRCKTNASFYLLERTLYKNIQKITNSASILQRNQWLLSCPELSHFTPIHMSRLFTTLKRIRFSKGDLLYEQNKETDYVLLIERGNASITHYPDVLTMSQHDHYYQDDIDKTLGIVRPKSRKSSLDTHSAHEFVSSYLRRAASTGYRDEDNVDDESPTSTKHLSKYITREESLPETEDISGLGLIYEGCIIGIPLLHSSSLKSDYGQWKYITSPYVLPKHLPTQIGLGSSSTDQNQNTNQFQSNYLTQGSFASGSHVGSVSSNSNVESHFQQQSQQQSQSQSQQYHSFQSQQSGNYEENQHPTRNGGYVISPITVTALTEMQCSIFTISAFEKAFGSLALSHNLPITPILSSKSSESKDDYEERRNSTNEQKDTTNSNSSTQSNSNSNSHSNSNSNKQNSNSHSHVSKRKQKNITFNPSLMTYERILGEGGFATVCLGHYNSDTSIPYAIKIMSKEKILDRGQLKHVLDEKKLLNLFSSDFILHMYGSFQTKDWVSIVTDVCELGDLWSVIYDTEVFQENECLPLELIQFYMCGIISGLGHMHSRHVIFRDLKPENIMINRKGYIKLIDCGLAKQIPYEEKDSSGCVNIVYKAHSLCGTPEYLAPEFLYNQGVDKAVDLWALGVLLFEMYMFRTPFANDETINNVELLFIAIASVQGSAPIPEDIIDEKSGSTNASSLIQQLLRSEPTERLGYEDTINILQHPYFHNFNHYAVLHQTYEPPFIPPEPPQYDTTGKINSTLHCDDITRLLKFKPYDGNDEIFKDFGPLTEY